MCGRIAAQANAQLDDDEKFTLTPHQLRVCPESWYCVTSISTKIYKRSFDGDLAKDAIERNPTPTVSVIRLLLKWLRPFKVYPPLY